MNEKKIPITYFEKGVKVETEFNIKLVPNHTNREYLVICQNTREYLTLHTEIVTVNALLNLQQERAVILADPKNKKTVKQKDIDDCMSKLQSFLSQIEGLKIKMEKYQGGNECDIYVQKINLIIWVMGKNGFKEPFDKFNFWDENLNPDDLDDFLNKICSKDLSIGDVKKKAV